MVKIFFSMHSIDRIKEDAEQAAKDEKTIVACPHEIGSVAERVWLKAFEEARKE